MRAGAIRSDGAGHHRCCPLQLQYLPEERLPAPDCSADNYIGSSIKDVKSFYIPRSHPDGISVNVNCLDEGTIEGVDVGRFDGRNWEENIAKLSPISD